DMRHDVERTARRVELAGGKSAVEAIVCGTVAQRMQLVVQFLRARGGRVECRLVPPGGDDHELAGPRRVADQLRAQVAWCAALRVVPGSEQRRAFALRGRPQLEVGYDVERTHVRSSRRSGRGLRRRINHAKTEQRQ